MKQGTTKLNVLDVGKRKTNTTAATPSPAAFGEFMKDQDIVPGQSKRPQMTSRHGSSQMTLGSETPQPNNRILPPMPEAVPNLSQIEIANTFPPIRVNPCM